MSAILPHEIKEIPQPFVVVCEGYGDIRFIDALLDLKNITNCSVGCPSTRGGFGTGYSDRYPKEESKPSRYLGHSRCRRKPSR